MKEQLSLKLKEMSEKIDELVKNFEEETGLTVIEIELTRSGDSFSGSIVSVGTSR